MMTIKSEKVTVGTSATLLSTGSETDYKNLNPTVVSAMYGRNTMVKNTHASSIMYCGGSEVTTANGFAVPTNGGVLIFSVMPGEGLYGIVASGTAVAEVLQGGI